MGTYTNLHVSPRSIKHVICGGTFSFKVCKKALRFHTLYDLVLIRQRRKILAASSVSSPLLLTVAQSGQLSQSAPSIMEPQLGPHSGIHARATSIIYKFILCTNQVKLPWLISTLKNVGFFMYGFASSAGLGCEDTGNKQKVNYSVPDSCVNN